jgi:hypothetical protein
LWTQARARRANRSAAVGSKPGGIVVVPALVIFADRSRRMTHDVEFIALPP